MGCRAHIIVVGGTERLADRAQQRLEQLEARWSRFRAESEISRLNAHAGHPVVVSAMTFELVALAVAESLATDGRFDPTVLPALLAAGYDRDFAHLRDRPATAHEPTGPSPGVQAITFDPIVRAVTLGPGTAIDVGGIAKGFAADRVSRELLDEGAAGACVNVGGDLRVMGAPPDGQAWSVAIEHEPGHVGRSGELPTLALLEGGVATTSRCRRVWRGADDTIRHHVIDPRTGRPAVVPWRSITVVAGDAASAEVGATAGLLSRDLSDAAQTLRSRASAALAFDDRGDAHELGDIRRFVAQARHA